MTQGIYVIKENIRLAPCIYKMTLTGDTSACTAHGQFVNILIDGLYLRRPISVHDYDGNSIVIIYKAVGAGTEKMAQMKEGQALDMLVGLGNGYDTSKSGNTPVLIGGGVGIPPLYGLCKRLVEEGKKPSVILGFNKAEEIFCHDEFSALTERVYITTVDGSAGTKGFVTDVLSKLDYSYFYTCGPMPMFRAVNRVAKTNGQFSFEERMGCGFGACMGCSCKTLTGYKRICKDGPVLEREEIKWENA